ncbi:MAG: zf-HC2 domain-containing protein [Gemmatimonadaceae bacterium]
MTTFNLTCDAVEATLPDYLDGTLEEWLRKPIEEHLRECVRCAERARDLRNLEREAAALPALLPARELWSGIAHRIGAPISATESVSESEPVMPTTEELVSTTEPSVTTIEPPGLMTEGSPATSEPLMTQSEPVALNIEPPTPSSVTTEPPLRPVPATEASPPASEPSATLSESSPTSSEPSPTLSEPSAMPSEPLPLESEPSAPSVEPSAPSSQPILSSSTALVRTTATTRKSPARRKMRWGPAEMGLAAAALVLVTAGATFLATAHWLGPTRTRSFANGSGARPVALGVTPQRVSSGAKARAEGAVPAPSVDSEHIAVDSVGSTLAGGVTPESLTVATASASKLTPSPDEVVYDKEIKMLRGVVRLRKAELDTSTAGVIDKNVRIVNSAIAQCRAALEKDPGNSLIDGQMSWALEMKVELLRRAAMLQARS